MPFITRQEATLLALGEELAGLIFGTGDEVFTALEKSAAQIITSETGAAAPGNAAEAPEWAKLPAALIIYSIGMERIERKEDQRADSDALYDRAMSILQKHVIKHSSHQPGRAEVVRIQGLEDAWAAS